MTQPVNEPTIPRSIAYGAWRTSQLERRPPPLSAGGRFVGIIFPSTTTLTVGNNAGGWFLVIPEDLGGSTLASCAAGVYTPGTGELIQVRNVTQAVDMLTTRISIDNAENTSYTAAAPPVIDPANSTVATGDIIVVDVDTAGGAVGLDIILAF
jgi:hypothetical protein